MNLHIPGLADALGRLDSLETDMGKLVTGIDAVVTLLQEQNERLAAIQLNLETPDWWPK